MMKIADMAFPRKNKNMEELDFTKIELGKFH